MIGDNPLSDIAGGNKAGFTTILVKTGVFNAGAPTSKNGNDIANPATHVVEDF
jgi:ribonucleotide monophosphatase NagD (HAD superfamily)